MNRFTYSQNLLSSLSTGKLLALTARLIIDEDVLIGYAVSPEEGYCVNLPFDEFIPVANSLYEQVNTPRIFHGLKRIWEFLDDRGLRRDRHEDKDVNINKIHDIKLLAHLLDPDSARSKADDNDEKLKEERPCI